MDHSDDHAVSPARGLPLRDLPPHDLMADVLDEYDRRRSALRIAELQLAQLDHLVIDGTIDYPTDLVQQVLACKRDVAAITEVLADMLRIGDSDAAAGGPQIAPPPPSDALPVVSSRRHRQKAGDASLSVGESVD